MSDTPPQTPQVEQEPEFSPFEQQFLDIMSARHPVSEGTDEGGSANGSEGPADASGDGVPAEGPGSESPEIDGQPEQGEPPGGGDGQPSPVFTLSGHDYTPEQLSQAIQVHDWFARLDPGAVQAIDGLLSGQYRLAPAQEAAPQPYTQPSGAVVSPGQTPSPPTPAEDEGEWLDPRAAREIADLRERVNTLGQYFQANLQPVVQHQMDADYQVRLDQISEASDSFRDRYHLEDDQMRTLEAAIVEAQVLPSLTSRFGSVGAGMNAALEMFFWTTPDYRDTFLSKQQSAVSAEQAATEADTVRKQQLTALSASGGSAPRREPVPQTAADRHEAMRQEIAAAMNGAGTLEQ